MIYIKLRPGYTVDFDDPKGAAEFWVFSYYANLVDFNRTGRKLTIFKTHVQGACYAH